MNDGLQDYVIREDLKRNGIEDDLVDVDAEMDRSLSLTENLSEIREKTALLKGKEAKEKSYVESKEEYEQRFKAWVEKNKDSTYADFVKLILQQPIVILVAGARGQGKTALSLRLLENIKADYPDRHTCVLGFHEDLPSWIEKYDNIEDTPYNAIVFIDEAGMYGHKKLFLQALTQARHNKQTLIYAVQNTANAGIDILRQADVLIFKKPSLFQASFERKIFKDIITEIKGKFDRFDNPKPYAWVISEEYTGMICSEPPSFWSEKISTAYRK